MWDEASRSLYWVDILECRIHRHGDDGDACWRTPELVGFVVPEADGTLLAGFASGLHRVALHDDGTVHADRIDRVADGDRFNDATRDSRGRLWACTLSTYYCYDENLARREVDRGYLVANGPALSPDERLLYTVETRGHAGRPQGVFVSRITPAGELAGQRLLVDWASRDSQPDGIVTDANGDLWVGEFQGNVLRRFSPDGEELDAVPLPAWNPTKPALAGDGTLYVTSARYGVADDRLARYPHTGGLLEISGIGSSS